jgi:formate hydrogenlyase subunit 3/multisubunit Na+/H+ antiporter MnhD subunit
MWSIVSLVLLVLTIIFAVLPFYFVRNSSTAGTTEGAALTVLVCSSCILAFLCVLVGFFAGWVGAQRSRRDMLLAWSGMAPSCCYWPLRSFLGVVFVFSRPLRSSFRFRAAAKAN